MSSKGKNFADVARGLRDIAGLARASDGIMDAADRANIDLQRDRLDLDRIRAGVDGDAENDYGIAIMPPVSVQLLENAPPDPDQNQNMQSNNCISSV